MNEKTIWTNLHLEKSRLDPGLATNGGRLSGATDFR